MRMSAPSAFVADGSASRLWEALVVERYLDDGYLEVGGGHLIAGEAIYTASVDRVPADDAEAIQRQVDRVVRQLTEEVTPSREAFRRQYGLPYSHRRLEGRTASKSGETPTAPMLEEASASALKGPEPRNEPAKSRGRIASWWSKKQTENTRFQFFMLTVAAGLVIALIIEAVTGGLSGIVDRTAGPDPVIDPPPTSTTEVPEPSSSSSTPETIPPTITAVSQASVVAESIDVIGVVRSKASIWVVTENEIIEVVIVLDDLEIKQRVEMPEDVNARTAHLDAIGRLWIEAWSRDTFVIDPATGEIQVTLRNLRNIHVPQQSDVVFGTLNNTLVSLDVECAFGVATDCFTTYENLDCTVAIDTFGQSADESPTWPAYVFLTQKAASCAGTPIPQDRSLLLARSDQNESLDEVASLPSSDAIAHTNEAFVLLTGSESPIRVDPLNPRGEVLSPDFSISRLSRLAHYDSGFFDIDFGQDLHRFDDGGSVAIGELAGLESCCDKVSAISDKELLVLDRKGTLWLFILP